MSRSIFKRILYCSLCWIIIYGCGTDKPTLKIETVEEQKINLKISRFEQDVFKTNPEQVSEGIALLKKNYGSFFDDFTLRILTMPGNDSIEFNQTFKSFVTDPDMKDVNAEILKLYGNISEIEADLSGAFSYFKHYYPDSLIPKIVTMNSGFNYAVVTTDSVLAIGLDMYLGDKCQYYPMLGFPKYKIATMSETYLVSDVVKGWASTIFEEPASSSNLLAKMIYQGKLLYFLDALMPETEDSIKIDYSSAQINWCIKNEADMWKNIVNRKLLFTTQNEEIVKILNEAPFTAGFPRESPGRIGQWLGWQIVRKYMKSHEEVKLQALMIDNDFEKIFRESKYKPK